MPRSRSSMRQIREVLRQKWELGFSARRIARSCGLSRSTVSNYLRRAEGGGLTWPEVARLDDTQLERVKKKASEMLVVPYAPLVNLREKNEY